jgi:hypothetical protein
MPIKHVKWFMRYVEESIYGLLKSWNCNFSIWLKNQKDQLSIFNDPHLKFHQNLMNGLQYT